MHAAAYVCGFGVVAAFHFFYQSLQFCTVVVGQSPPAANQGNEVGLDVVDVRLAAQVVLACQVQGSSYLPKDKRIFTISRMVREWSGASLSTLE